MIGRQRLVFKLSSSPITLAERAPRGAIGKPDAIVRVHAPRIPTRAPQTRATATSGGEYATANLRRREAKRFVSLNSAGCATARPSFVDV
jgi:hypothetical protein